MKLIDDADLTSDGDADVIARKIPQIQRSKQAEEKLSCTGR